MQEEQGLSVFRLDLQFHDSLAPDVLGVQGVNFVTRLDFL